MKSQILGSLISVLSIICSISVAQAEIKVGIAGPLTGSAFTVGEQQEFGVQVAIDHLNDEGGLLGEKIVSISVDDACLPRPAEAAARLLVKEGVTFVVGHVCSSCALAASKIYEEAGIIMITPSASNPKLTDEGGPNVFRANGRDDEQGVIAGNYLADNYSNSNIAIIHDGQAYGMGLAEFTKHQLNKRGVNEVMFDSYRADQKDYNSVVERLVTKKTDVLYAGGYQNDIAIIIRQVKKQLPDLRLVSGDSLATAEFMFIAGKVGTGTHFTFGRDLRSSPENQKIISFFRDDHGFEPEGYTLYSYGVVQAWAQAVKQAGSFETDAVINALREGSFDTVLGKIGFDEKGDITGVSNFVWYVFGKQKYMLAD